MNAGKSLSDFHTVTLRPEQADRFKSSEKRDASFQSPYLILSSAPQQRQPPPPTTYNCLQMLINQHLKLQPFAMPVSVLLLSLDAKLEVTAEQGCQQKVTGSQAVVEAS